MALRAVFFDMDDTLVATSASRHDRARLAVEHLVGAHPELECEALIARMLEHGDYPWARGVEPVLREFGLIESPVAAGAIDLWFFRGCEHLLVPEPGVPELLRGLQARYRTGVITNGLEHRQTHKFGHLGISDGIDVFVTSERAGARKPSAEPFLLALQEAGVAPHEAVYVGDSLETDVAGSMAAGMHAIWYNPFDEPPPTEMPAVQQLRALTELPGLIAEWP